MLTKATWAKLRAKLAANQDGSKEGGGKGRSVEADQSYLGNGWGQSLGKVAGKEAGVKARNEDLTKATWASTGSQARGKADAKKLGPKLVTKADQSYLGKGWGQS